MLAFRRASLALTALLLLSGCNVILPRLPGIYVLDTGLGNFESRPTWAWEVYGPDIIQGFRYSLDSESTWIELDHRVRSFQSPSGLLPGEYSLHLQAKSVSGLWSKSVSAQAIVEDANTFSPNDPYFAGTAATDDIGQWALTSAGVPDLWGYLKYMEALGTMRNDVTVAVIDTGYTAHPDLLPNLLIDDGFDFILIPEDARDGNGIDSNATDMGDSDSFNPEDSWHGTGVASVIAAVTDNSEGMSGIGIGRLKVLPVRALGVGGGTTYDIAQAVLYAAGLPNDSETLPTVTAKIINLSIGAYLSGTTDPHVEPALQAAREKGIIIVASAGNERMAPYNEVEVAYPASSIHTIAVAASTAPVLVDGFPIIAPYSNPGTLVDITAPGGLGDDSNSWYDWVVTATRDTDSETAENPEGYAYGGVVGTSIAAPHVSGLLALLCTVDDFMNLDTAMLVLSRSAMDLGSPGWDQDFGHGLIDPLAAFGEYRLLIDSGAARTSNFDAKMISDNPIPYSDAPQGELAENSLILVFSSAAAKSTSGAQGRITELGGRIVVASANRSQLVKPAAEVDPAALREALLMEPGVEEVFYNYIYRPL
jgi:subtilisin family serine protease